MTVVPSDFFHLEVQTFLDAVKRSPDASIEGIISDFGRKLDGVIHFESTLKTQNCFSLALIRNQLSYLCAARLWVFETAQAVLPVRTPPLALSHGSHTDYFKELLVCSMPQLQSLRLNKHLKHGDHLQRLDAFAVLRHVTIRTGQRDIPSILNEQTKSRKEATEIYVRMFVDEARAAQQAGGGPSDALSPVSTASPQPPTPQQLQQLQQQQQSNNTSSQLQPQQQSQLTVDTSGPITPRRPATSPAHFKDSTAFRMSMDSRLVAGRNALCCHHLNFSNSINSAANVCARV